MKTSCYHAMACAEHAGVRRSGEGTDLCHPSFTTKTVRTSETESLDGDHSTARSGEELRSPGELVAQRQSFFVAGQSRDMAESVSVPSPRAPNPLGAHQAPATEAAPEENSSPNDRHQCYLCSRTYERADHLTRHLKSHDNERTYRCPECGKGFNRA